MKTIPENILFPVALQQMKRQAMIGLFHGTDDLYDQIYLAESRWYFLKFGCIIVLTRDTGHHSSGWWKNPDYERCWHLSISFPGGRDIKAIEKIVDGLFGEHKKWIWIEPPHGPYGKQAEVWHYRLFCDEHWQPIKPRGEVYTKQFTKKGWKSYTEVQAAKGNP